MKRIAVWTVALLVVLVAVDFVLASVAEYQLSSRLKDQLSLPDEPAVRIAGFPFLTQAVLGEYRKVDVAAAYVGRGSMHNVGEFAELYRVHVPLSEVLTGSVRNVLVDSAAASVVITKEDLLKLLDGMAKVAVSPVTDATLDDATINAKNALPGSSVTGVDPTDAVLISGDMSVRGRKTRVSVIASMALADGQIEITPRDIRLAGVDGAQLLPQTQVALRAAFSLMINPGTLPFSLAPTRLRAVGDGIAVSGTGRNITIAPSSQRTDSVN